MIRFSQSLVVEDQMPDLLLVEVLYGAPILDAERCHQEH